LSKGAHSSLTPNNNILIINKIKFPSPQKEKKNPTTKLKLWSYCVCSCFNEPSIPTPQVGKMGKRMVARSKCLKTWNSQGCPK
jgi:hypothetical protein